MKEEKELSEIEINPKNHKATYGLLAGSGREM